MGAIIGVFGSRGGTGKSVLAVNLAVNLLLESRERVLLLDLGLPVSMDAGRLLDLKEVRGLDHLLTSAGTLPPAMLAGYATVHKSGLSVLALAPGPDAPPPEVHDPERLGALLAKLAAGYAWVAADLGAYRGPATARVLDLCSLILVPATPDYLSIQHAVADFAFLRALNLPQARVKLVYNASGRDETITRAVMEQATRKEVFAELPSDRNLAANLAGGRTYPVDHPRHDMTMALDALTHAILTGLAPDQARPGTAPAPDAPPDRAGLDRIKEAVHQRLLETFDLKYADMQAETDPEKLKELRREVTGRVTAILDEQTRITSREVRERLVREVLQDVLGLGPLEDLLADPAVSEIMVNRHDAVYVERKGRIEPAETAFLSEKHLIRVIERIVAPLGRKIDAATPMVDARLPDGSRVNAIIPPLAVKGAALTVRKFLDRAMDVDDLVRLGSFSRQMAEFLRAAVLARMNILVSGGTGSGKTTLLNLLSGFIPRDERIITVEDSAELKLRQPHVITLEARPPNIEGKGEVQIRDLVRNTLRMRPDRILVGECRGAEALDMLQAMNTGHDGSMTTVHANSAREALSRVETLVMFAGFELPSRAIREQIAGALDLVVQIRRFKDGGRRIVQVAEVTGLESEVITLGDVFLFRQEAQGPDQAVRGTHVSTGYIPRCLKAFEEKGVSLPREIFWTPTAKPEGGAKP